VPDRALVIVPAWNEEATVRDVVSAVRASGRAVLVVDDGSVDETGAEARAAGASVLRLPINLGVGAALRFGFREAVRRGYDAVVQCDADGQHEPAAIDLLLETLNAQDLDMVIGSRFAPGAPAYEVGLARRLAMRTLAEFATRAAGTSITDPTSGFRAIGPRLLAEFARTYPAEYLGDTAEALISAARGGYRVGEVPVPMHERRGGVASTGSISAVWYTLRVIAIVSVRWHRPPQEGP